MSGGRAAPAAPPAPASAERIAGDRLPLLERYADLLAGDGVERGLIGPRERARLWERHLLNCAVVAPALPSGATVVDVGSGAGLPGVVLAVVRPDLRLVLLEPQLRRATFLGECVQALALTNATVRRERVEQAAAWLRADVAVARAVAPLPRLVALCTRVLRPGGVLLALKGEQVDAEVEQVRRDLRRYGLAELTVERYGEGVVQPPTTVVRARRLDRLPRPRPRGRRAGPRERG